MAHKTNIYPLEPRGRRSTNHLIQWDGMKATDLWSGDRGWDVLSGAASGDSQRRMTAQDYFIAVPWLYRAVKDRATTHESIPFAIVDDKGADLDVSGTWQDELNIFPNPRQLIHKIIESLVMAGSAYLFLETNAYGYVKAVKYCLPTSIREKYDDNGELMYYERFLKGSMRQVDPANMVAIYDPDYTVEQGPGQSSAAKAALLAAGVLFNTDQFIASYFARGAIKPTILAVDTSDQKEANRVQAWWEDVVAGIKNAWAAIVMRGKTATATVIGSGLEGLENDSLTKSKRQDISTAIGVPESRMWASAANFATAEIESKTYIHDVIIPWCWMLEEAYNSQIFTAEHHMDRYRWEFRPEMGTSFGRDQQGQAIAYMSYVKQSGMLPSIAAQIVGIELPGEMTYEDLDPKGTTEPPENNTGIPNTTLVQTGTPVVPTTAPAAPDAQAVRSALFAWKSAAMAAVKTGHSANIDFDNPIIPMPVYEFLKYELADCTKVEDVHTIFKKAREMAKLDSEAIAVLEGIRLGVEALKAARDATKAALRERSEV